MRLFLAACMALMVVPQVVHAQGIAPAGDGAPAARLLDRRAFDTSKSDPAALAMTPALCRCQVIVRDGRRTDEEK